LGAVGGLRKVDLRADCDIAALDRTARSLAAEGAAKGTTSAEECVEDVSHRAEGVEVGRVAAAAQALVPVAVIGGPPLGVGKNLIGLGRLLELVLRVGIVAVDVGMQLARQAPEGLF